MRLVTLRPDPSGQPTPEGENPPLASEKSEASSVDGVDAARLATNAETTDQGAVALYIALLHVIEQTAALTDELHEATTGVMITLVNLQVLGEVRDPVRQDRDLDLG